MGKKTKLSNISNEKKAMKQMFKCKRASVAAGLSISLLTFSSVEALNIGEARSQSYLGQPLSIFVPVTDTAEIIDLNQLVVSKPTPSQLTELDVPSEQDGLSYKIVVNGSEKGILITSDSPFNDPFIDLGVKIDYQGVSQLRKLTALIDLQPLAGGGTAATVGTPLETQNANISSTVINAGQNSSTRNTIKANVNTGLVTYSGEIMGPYDWAQSGAIPEKFGPVLEGQSLWRVARRINESMNVSIDQMMWALFRANPQAFVGDDVSTLQSGSVLTIPSESFVREVTELGAVRLLNPETIAESNGSIAGDVAEGVNDETNVYTNQEIQTGSENVLSISEINSVDQSTNEQTPVDPLTELNPTEIARVEGSNVVSLSQLNIVDGLKTEIVYLNEQLAAQEARIQVLEKRLAISGPSNSELSVNNAVVIPNDQALTNNEEAPVSEPINVVEAIKESTITDSIGTSLNNVDATPDAIISTETVPNETTSNEAVSPVAASKTVEPATEKTGFSIIPWAISALGLFLLGLAYFTRHRFMPALLNLFSKNYEYDEEASFFDSVSKKRVVRRDLSQVQQPSVPNESHHDVISDNNEEVEDFEDYSFFVDDEELMDVEELSFPDRIKQLIDSGDYDEAKKTVNFASVANVNEHEINIYLLKIFAAESDRESFDKLFDKIHANIDHYDADAQLMIAELQSEMAIGKVINFGSDQIAS